MRASDQRGQGRTRPLANAAACALGLAWAAGFSSPAHAQDAATLNGYRAAPLPSDGFVVNGADAGQHLELSLQLHADYANDPLVYEDIAGAVGTERAALVSDQLTLHPTAALGLFDAAIVFVAMPVNVLMDGSVLGQQPTATGFGPGDLAFGGRIQLQRSRVSKVAAQLTVTLPTGEAGKHGRPGVAGESGTTAEPRITAEIDGGVLQVLLNAGLRAREDTEFAGTRFTDALTFGAALRVPLLQGHLLALAELFGEAPIDDIGDRAGSPLQGLIGAKLLPLHGLTLGLAGGAGLLRGYGAPDARLAVVVGYALPLAEREEKPKGVEGPPRVAEPTYAGPSSAPVVLQSFDAEAVQKETIDDRDHDGVADIDDRCPAAPGEAQVSGCPQRILYDEQSGAITFLQALRFEAGKAELQARGEEALGEVIALLRSAPVMHVRVEGHLSLGRHADVVAGLRLSAERASAVAGYLVERGIAPARLEAVGCAANRPLVPDAGAQRFKNERVELYVIDPLPEAGIRSTLGCIEGEVPGAEPPKALQEGGGPAKPPAAPAPSAAPVPAPAPVPPAAATTAPRPAAAPAPSARPAAEPIIAAPKPASASSIAPPAPPKPSAPAPVLSPPPAAPPAVRTPPAAPAPAAPVPPAPAKPAPAPAPPSHAGAPSALPAVAATTTAAAALAAIAGSPKGDADGDSILNADDHCPLAPRSAAGSEPGCPESHKVDLDGGRIELLRPIRFEEGETTPSARSAAHLDEIAATLRANPTMRVVIEAHVAEETSADASLALTRARAAALRRALATRGVPQARMRAYGCGQARPIAPNNVPWGRKRNERVELYVLDPAPTSGVHSTEGCAAAE